MYLIRLLLLGSLLLPPALVAADTLADVDKQIRSSLQVLLPNLQPDAIRETPLAGLYEVTFGIRVVYLSADGRYLMQGKLTDLETRREITEERLSALKRDLLAQLGDDDMIVYGPADAPYTITVFTDIDCGYCRKLHSEMADYNAAGIRVRYLFYPRAGIGSESYAKAVAVWCADDRHAAMDQAKAGGSLEPRSCDNPVAEHFALGQQMGIRGTPAILLEDGSIIPGYMPPAQLLVKLKGRMGAR